MMPDAARPLLLVGGGKMGEALLAGWLHQGLPPDAVTVVEPDAGRRRHLGQLHGIRTVPHAAELADAFAPGTVLLAVKPQMMDAVLPELVRLVATDTLVLSIAAGSR